MGRPCAYCTNAMQESPPEHRPTRDHVLPAARGFRFCDFNGRNKAIACRACNEDKGGLDIFAWHWRLRKANDPRAKHVAAFIARSGLTVEMAQSLPPHLQRAQDKRQHKAALQHAAECSALWAKVENPKPDSP